LFGETYVECGLGATHVWGLGVKLASDLPLTLSLLDLSCQSDISLPAIIINKIALGLAGHLVVGEGHLGGALAVILLKSADSLNNLGGGRGTVGALSNLALGLPLHGQVLHSSIRSIRCIISLTFGSHDDHKQGRYIAR